MKFGFLFGVVLFIGACSASHRPTIRVRNEAAAVLTNVKLTGRSFDTTIASVLPGQTREVRVSPRGETGVAVSFVANGSRVNVPEQGYFEASWWYTVDVTITREHQVTVHATTRRTPW